jgi:Right handed beta helix region
MPSFGLLWAIVVAAIFSRVATAEDAVPALSRLLSDLPADHSVLEIPAGVYTVGSSWTVARSGVTIRGAGMGKTILVRDSHFDGALVKMDAANSSISNLTLDGNGAANVLFLNRPGVVADSVEVKNFTHIGIAVPASGCRVTNCFVNGPSIQTTMGVWHDGGRTSSDSTIVIDHNVIKNTGLYGTGGEITITNNQISGEPNPGGGQIDVGNAFTKNTIALITENNILNGGTIRTGGIELGGGRFTVANNTIRNHGAAGIGVGHNAVRAVITGNTISNSGRNTDDKNRPQNRSGIYVLYGAQNVEISGNRCFDDQPMKTQTWGIILTGLPARPDPRFPAKTTEHVTISNNDLRGNIHPEGLLDESGARDKIISGNLPAKANR